MYLDMRKKLGHVGRREDQMKGWKFTIKAMKAENNSLHVGLHVGGREKSYDLDCQVTFTLSQTIPGSRN